MNKIKNNLVFSILFIGMSCIITVLVIMIINQNQGNTEETNNESNSVIVDTKTTSITYFNGKYETLSDSVALSWTIAEYDNEVVDMQIIQDEEVIATYTSGASTILGIEEYDLKTGNNMFTLVVNLEDETKLSKTVYVYVDEVYNFEVETKYDGYTSYDVVISYSYDIRQSVSIPTVSYSASTNSFDLSYVSNSIVSTNGNKVHAQAVYELDFTNVLVGNYDLEFLFKFSSYNLTFDYETNVQVINISSE